MIGKMLSRILCLTLGLFLCTINTYADNYFKDGKPLHLRGPKSLKDKIAIVGAGPSGIHMAAALRELGFTNIDVYEKQNRIGGKSMSMNDPKNTVQELGSCCIGPGYESNIIELIEKYAPGTLVRRKFASVWLDDRPDSILYTSYVIKETMQHFRLKSPAEAMVKLGELIAKYSQIHMQMFGTYEFELMPRPTSEILQSIDCSYMEFLKRHELEGLRPLLLLTHTVQGYGYVDEIAALYGLMWNTPYLLQSLLALANNSPTATPAYLLRIGFQKLWEEIAEKDKLRVFLRSKVTGVYQNENYVKIKVNDTWKQYDFLMWSPEMRASLPSFRSLNRRERMMFGATKNDFLISTLVRLVGGKRAPTPTAYWLDNLVKKRSMTIWASRNSKEVFDYGIANTSRVDDARYELAYQYSTDIPCKPLRKAYAHFDAMGAEEIEIPLQKVWRYFPHYTSHRLSTGVLWDILEMQGKGRTWYIGSSVSFESLKSVIEYNKLLLSLMLPITD